MSTEYPSSFVTYRFVVCILRKAYSLLHAQMSTGDAYWSEMTSGNIALINSDMEH